MEVKKSIKADLENQKSTSIMIGFIVSLAAMLAAFEWTTHEYKDKDAVFNKSSFDPTENVEMLPLTQPVFKNTPPPPVETTQVSDILDIIENDDDVEETKIETPEDLNTAIFGPTVAHSGSIMAPPAPTVEKSNEDEVFEAVEEDPEFPGGLKALMNWLSMNLKYPIGAQEAGIQGRVLVSFIVNKDGSIVEPRIVKPVDPALDKEAIRVVSRMPRWRPGKQQKKPVRVKFTLPVSFRIQ